MGGDAADREEFKTRVKVTKELLYFRNQCMTCKKAPKGLQGTSGVKVNARMERNIEHNFVVKMEAITGREMNMSKSGKTAAQATSSLDLNPSV